MNWNAFFTPLKVGVLVIAGVVAGLSMMVVLSGDYRISADDEKTYYAYLDDVTGLAVRSRVHMAGIPVGTVESIELVGEKARVELSIQGDLTLYEGVEQDGWYINGAVVAKRQATLIGDFYIRVTPGQQGRVLEDGDTIHNVTEAVQPEEMVDQFQEITSDIQQVTETMATVFGGEDAQEILGQMLLDMQVMVSTLNKFVDTNSAQIERLVTDVERLVADATKIGQDISMLTERGADSLDTILRDTEAIVQEVRFIIGQSTTDVQAGLGTMQATLSRLQRTLDSLNYSLHNVQDITEKVNEGEGTVGQLVNNPNIAHSTEQILADSSELLGSVMSLRTVVELRSEYHMSHQQMKTTFGLSLIPSDDKYYMVEFIDDFRGSTTVQTQRVETTDAGADDPVYQETRTTTTDEFKFSLLMGRSRQITDSMRLGGRFGIMESSGGLGAEAQLFPDQQLQLNTDVFDFGAAENPRVRSFGTYRFFQFAYLFGGIDDIFNQERRDYFMGAGVRFDDEDLRTLLMTAGGALPDL